MRRLMVLVTVVMLMAAMMVFAGPASALAGCQDFGTLVKDEAIEEGGSEGVFAERIIAGAQEEVAKGADDEANELKAACVEP